MDPRIAAYQNILSEMANYQRTLQSEIAEKQLDKLDIKSKESWNNYLIELIQKLLAKDNLINISSNHSILVRKIKALKMEDNLSINRNGIIVFKE